MRELAPRLPRGHAALRRTLARRRLDHRSVHAPADPFPGGETHPETPGRDPRSRQHDSQPNSPAPGEKPMDSAPAGRGSARTADRADPGRPEAVPGGGSSLETSADARPRASGQAAMERAHERAFAPRRPAATVLGAYP